jgi:hypothetical protein
LLLLFCSGRQLEVRGQIFARMLMTARMGLSKEIAISCPFVSPSICSLESQNFIPTFTSYTQSTYTEQKFHLFANWAGILARQKGQGRIWLSANLPPALPHTDLHTSRHEHEVL